MHSYVYYIRMTTIEEKNNSNILRILELEHEISILKNIPKK